MFCLFIEGEGSKFLLWRVVWGSLWFGLLVMFWVWAFLFLFNTEIRNSLKFTLAFLSHCSSSSQKHSVTAFW